MALQKTLRLVPQVKEVVWGGNWLQENLNRSAKKGALLGESWEAYSASVVFEGEFADRTLESLWKEFGVKLFGEKSEKYPAFPLLAKFIDARQNLSIQVHPNNELAQKLENYPYGKTEFWYVLEATPNAEIIYGLKENVSHETLKISLQKGDILEHCRKVSVQKGDIVFIPAGTVHALTEGVVVYELQQNCDITYRLYDWGRVGREIHLKKGLEVISFADSSLAITQPDWQENITDFRNATLAKCEYFESLILEIRSAMPLSSPKESFAILSIIEGEAEIPSENLHLKTGDTLLLPAGFSTSLRSISETCTLILSYLC